jgi:hypothetical protein
VSFVYRPVVTPASTIAQTAGGTWTRVGATVTYFPEGASPSGGGTMRWTEPTLTLVDASATIPVTLVFRK